MFGIHIPKNHAFWILKNNAFWRLGVSGLALLSLLYTSLSYQPAEALVKMDKESVVLALKYGMQNKSLGYRALLGSNWIEGPDGCLLNVYTPFMMLAVKGFHGDYPENPTEKDIEKAKNRNARYVTNFLDPLYKKEIKFSLSMYGEDAGFAYLYRARIKGFGRGKEFTLKPSREYRQKIANFDKEASVKPYDGINTYYFSFDDIAILDEYTFIVEDGIHEPVEFNLRNASLY
jgi:hypothetical protein